jgi:AraC-like DNA-binding protein
MAASAEATPGAARRVSERTRLLRGPAEGPSWELWERTPPAAFAGLVAGFFAGASELGVSRHRLLPNGELLFMFDLGPGQRLTELGGRACRTSLGGAFLAGLRQRPATFETCEARATVVAARLLPLGAQALLGGLPQAELAERVLDAGDVLGRGAEIDTLRCRMAEAPSLGLALEALERWLLERFTKTRHPAHRATRAVAARLQDTHGRLRVEDLAGTAEVSPRRLRELFQREVGVPPKRLARILRFRHALEHLATAPAVDLTRLALDCGYYDLAHLYRDFRALAGMTPLDYLALRGEGLDGPDVIGG